MSGLLDFICDTEIIGQKMLGILKQNPREVCNAFFAKISALFFLNIKELANSSKCESGMYSKREHS
jgi:hypothetical protein